MVTSKFIIFMYKVFDTVRHHTLFEKFAGLRIPINIYNWLVKFFKDIHAAQNMGTTFPPLVKYPQALFKALLSGLHLM